MHVPRCDEDLGFVPPTPEIGYKGGRVRQIRIHREDVPASRLCKAGA
jgi:hypothetical protein